MENSAMIMNDEMTWPNDVMAYLEQYVDLFNGWEHNSDADNTGKHVRVSAKDFDQAVYGLREVLNGHSIEGYHCTRLTDYEIAKILSEGMGLSDGDVLSSRIHQLLVDKLILPSIADMLRQVNQADEEYRAGRIWFCCYDPHHAGKGGIERLLRSWGGEALYNSHERNPITGPILKSLGTPCLVHVRVPMVDIAPHSFLERHVYQQFLHKRFDNAHEIRHEDRVIRPISAQNIRRIIRFPKTDFISLTQCEAWVPPLT